MNSSDFNTTELEGLVKSLLRESIAPQTQVVDPPQGDSLLGYAAGQHVEGLMVQDDLSDTHIVDPVFIAGLPRLEAQEKLQ